MKKILLTTLILLTSCDNLEKTNIKNYNITTYCNLDDCSKWNQESIAEFLDMVNKYWTFMFPKEHSLVMAKNIFIEKEEDVTCRLLPETFTENHHCGGWSDFDTVHVQATLDGYVLDPYMSQLVHELTHSHYDQLFNDGDSNHSKQGGHWTKSNDILINAIRRHGCEGWEELNTPCE